MQDRLRTISLVRLGVLALRPGQSSPSVVAPAIAELARLGVTVNNPEQLTDDIAQCFDSVRSTLAALRGIELPAPLFDGFPERLPLYDDADLRFLIAGVRLADRLETLERSHDATELLHAVMDFSAFGWWPASSVPVDPERAAVQRFAQLTRRTDTSKAASSLRVVGEDELDVALIDWVANVAYSPSSLPSDVLDDFDFLVSSGYGHHLDLTRVRFGEIRAHLAAAHVARPTDPTTEATLRCLLTCPDDVARTLAALSGSDISLATPIKFPRLSRAQRRLVVAVLDNDRISDIFRRRGLWLAVAKSLHVGEYATEHPRVVTAFSHLRTQRRDRTTPSSLAESLLARNDVLGAAQILCAYAPTSLLRQLRRYAHHVGLADRPAFVESVRHCASRAPLRLVMNLCALINDNGATYPRVAFDVAARPHKVAFSAGHLAIDDAFAHELTVALGHAALDHLRDRPSWQGERVWVDPRVARVLLPEQLRHHDASLATLSRGSRVTTATAKVLRLFLHWVQPGDGSSDSDLDLSCVVLDENYRILTHVSWNNLASDAMVHSGDLTSAPAPHGASEFIDVSLGDLPSTWRYLVPAVYCFSGPRPSELPVALTGYMLRTHASTEYKTFDPATVENVFPLRRPARVAYPFIYDLATHECVALNATNSSGSGHHVGEDHFLAFLAEAALVSSNYRASLSDLVLAHVEARGASLCASREKATITFGLSDEETYNVTRPEKILAELL